MLAGPSPPGLIQDDGHPHRRAKSFDLPEPNPDPSRENHMNIILLLTPALLGAAPQPSAPDVDPTVAVLVALAAEFATLAEGEPRSITVDPRWRERFPIPPPDTIILFRFEDERMAAPLRESLGARLPGIEFCEGVPVVTHCIESAENVHLAFAPLTFDGDRIRAQVVGWWRAAPGRRLTVVEMWEFTLELDGDRAIVVSRERIMQGHGRIRTP